MFSHIYFFHLPQAINVQNSKGQTALMLACRGGHYACAKFLLIHGASPLPADEQVPGTRCGRDSVDVII